MFVLSLVWLLILCCFVCFFNVGRVLLKFIYEKEVIMPSVFRFGRPFQMGSSDKFLLCSSVVTGAFSMNLNTLVNLVPLLKVCGLPEFTL